MVWRKVTKAPISLVYHVVAGDARGHVGDLGVHRRVGEDQGAAREQYLVEGLRCPASPRRHALDAEIAGAAGGAGGVPGLRELYLQDQVQLTGQHLARLEEADQGWGHQHVAVLAGGDGHGVPSEVLPEALQAALVVPFLRLQHRVEEAAPPIFGDVIRALAVGIELDPLDEAAGLDGAGEQVARGVVVPDPEGNLDALGVDEVHPTRQRDSGHAAGGGRKGGKRRWKILDVAPRLYIIDVGRRELVVQALHQFIVHRLGDVLHRLYSGQASSRSLLS